MKLNRSRGVFGGIKDTVRISRALKSSCLAFAVFLLAFVFVPYIVNDANAQTAQVSLTWRKVFLSLDTGSNSGNVNYGTVTPTAYLNDNYGTLAVQKKTLTVDTSGKDFKIYLSMDSTAGGSGTKQALCYGFNNSAAEGVDPCGAGAAGISPVTENNGNPAALQTNGWGYAIPGGTGFSSAASYDTTTGISADSTGYTSNYGGAKADVLAETLYAAKWAAVPAYGTTADNIWTAHTENLYGFGDYELDGVSYSSTSGDATQTDGDNSMDVYYGVMVNTNTVAGTYGNRILYTAVASAGSFNEPSKNILSDMSYGGPTDRIRLFMDLDGDIDEDDIEHIYLVKHSDAATVDAAGNNGGSIDTAAEYASLASYLVEDVDSHTAAECSVVSGSVEVATGESGNYGFNVKCDMPDLGAEAEGVDYDFVVELGLDTGLGLNYVSYDSTVDGKFRYVGLQTRVGGNTAGNAHYVKNMQDMTAGVCKMTNKWGSNISYIGGQTHNLLQGDDTTEGTRQYIYSHIYGEGGGTNAVNQAVGESTAGNFGAPTLTNAYGGTKWADADGGSYTLTDIRDGKSYLVRKLADGNCWMVQNLDLELYTDTVLDSTNTDLGYDTTTKSYPETAKTWSPAATGEEKVDEGSQYPNLDNSNWASEKGYETVTLYAVASDDTETQVGQCTGGTDTHPCYVAQSNVVSGSLSYQVRKSGASDSDNVNWTSNGQGAYRTFGTTCTEGAVGAEKGCKVVTDGDAETGNYIITQMGNIGGVNNYVAPAAASTATVATHTGDWRWAQRGDDGAHVYDQGPLMYRNSFTDVSGTEYKGKNIGSNAYSVSDSQYGTCDSDGTNGTWSTGQGTLNGKTIKQGESETLVNALTLGNTYTIGTTTGSLKKADGTYRSYVTCKKATADDDGRTNAADSGFAGNWYNWYAATAGTGKYDSTGEVSDSLCPSGWRLPKDVQNNTTANSGSEFYNLLVLQYGMKVGSNAGDGVNHGNDYFRNADTAVLSFPLSFIRSGFYYWNIGGLNGRTNGGNFWSSYASSVTYSRVLNFYGRYLYPQFGYNKGYGFAVRCVAR